MIDDADHQPLPRRDWFLLPLVVIGTTLALCLIAELLSRALFVESGKFTCAVHVNTIMRQKPNCVSYYKNAEGPNVEYRFNNCGYRSPDPCGPKPAGTARIVFMGTSLTMGLHVREEDMFPVRTERALRLQGRRVDSQNLAGLMRLEQQIGFTPEALALSPDVIVLTVMPWDLEELAGPEPAGAPVAAPAKPPGWFRSMVQDINTQIRGSKSVFAVAHFIFQDPQTVYRYYLTEGHSREVIGSPLSATGQQMYDGFSSLMGNFMSQVRKSGVPVIVVAAPNRVTAAIVSTNARVEKTDAWSFGRRVCSIATNAGALCVDTTPDFARIPDAERLFYAVDNHPTGEGHAVIANAITARLIDGSITPLATTSAWATR